jgi:RNA polymerase sigma factor (sigma-70 family)
MIRCNQEKVTQPAKIFSMHESDSDTNALGRLMDLAQRGDAAAYVELLQAITPTIRRIVGSQRGFAGREEVEDLVQEILLSLHKVRATYDPARPFVPWLQAIIRNRLADGARRYSRTGQREVSIDDEDVTFFELEANSDSGEPNDVDVLKRAVHDLPEAQRQAIELLKLRELSLKEAAAITGSSEASLKVATHRAIASLRKALGTKDT